MVETGFSKPSNTVVTDSVLPPKFMKIGANATAAKCIPGIAVVRDANDYSVKEGATKVVGTLGYEATPAAYKPATPTTAYAVGNTAAVHSGPRRCKMWLAASQTIVTGDPLKVTTDGYLAAATIGTDDVYCDAAESVTTGEGETAAIWVETRR